MDYARLNQLLIAYRLTKNEAKILSALIQSKCYLTVKQISFVSNVARESVYKNLLSLRKRSFIEKEISKPEKYCSIPLRYIIEILHEEKSQELRRLEELKAKVLIENSQNFSTPQFNSSKFVLVPCKKQLVRRIEQAVSNSKKSIKVKTSWKRHLQSMIVYEKAIKKAISNGTKFQVFITMKPPQEEIPENIKFFYNSPSTSIKLVSATSKMVFIIVDDHETFLMTQPRTNIKESPALWSNNNSIVTAFTTCFDLIWEKSTTVSQQFCVS